MQVQEIWRFPVKSLCGEQLEFAEIDERGISYDRSWGIFDPATGLILTARREPALLMASAQVVNSEPVITLADGTNATSDAQLSAWLDRPVELRASTQGEGTFENPLDVDNESDWIEWQSSGGTFHDGQSKISFVSFDSLGEWNHRRFRINLIVDESGEGQMTDDIAVGSAQLRIRKPIERCIMVTRAQPGIDKDISVLKRVIKEHDNQMGVGAIITQAGTITVGDAVTAI